MVKGFFRDNLGFFLVLLFFFGMGWSYYYYYTTVSMGDVCGLIPAGKEGSIKYSSGSFYYNIDIAKNSDYTDFADDGVIVAIDVDESVFDQPSEISFDNKSILVDCPRVKRGDKR